MSEQRDPEVPYWCVYTDAAGVSRRTLFRHFGSRERLIAAAFSAGMAGYTEQLPDYDGDLESWLRATCDTVHRMNSSFGPGFWELTARADLPPDLAATERRRRRGFRAEMAHIATVLWHCSDHDDEAPDTLVRAVGTHLSPHFTAAVMTDVGDRWQVASDLAQDGILLALHRYALAPGPD